MPREMRPPTAPAPPMPMALARPRSWRSFAIAGIVNGVIVASDLALAGIFLPHPRGLCAEAPRQGQAPTCEPAASSTMSRGCQPNGGTSEDVSGGEQVVRWTPLFHLEAQLKTLCEALQMEAHRGLLLRQTSYQNSSCQHRTKTRRVASLCSRHIVPGRRRGRGRLKEYIKQLYIIII